MSRRWRRVTHGLTFALIVALMVLASLLSLIAFTSGTFCSWPAWTRPGFESRVWGVCR